MNTTEHTNNSSTTDGASESLRLVTLVFFILTFVFGSTGNLLVLLVVAKKSIRTLNDILIVHLAVSDLCFIFFCLPVFIYMQVSEFRGSKEYCKFIWPMMTVTFSAGIFTVTLMAVHRCKVILHPFQGTFLKRQLLLCFLVIWLLSFLIALPLMIVVKVGSSGACYEDWPTHYHRRAYTAMLAGMQYGLPLVIIAVAYVKIGVELFCSKQRGSFTSPRTKHDETRKQENIKVVKVLATIVISFAICMLPNHMAWMLLDFGGTRGQKLAREIFKFSDVLAVFHSCLNPIIYGSVTRQFRQGHIRYLSLLLYCLPSTAVAGACERACCVQVLANTESQHPTQTLLRMDHLTPSQSNRCSQRMV